MALGCAVTTSAKTVRESIARSRARLKARHLDALRRRITEALNQEPRLEAGVYLFGSWASDRFDAQSDTDLLAVVPDGTDGGEVERRLMQVAEDVVTVSESQWHARLTENAGFWQRLAAERVLLTDTRGGQR